MTDTITHKGRTYTLAEPVYSSTIYGNPVAEANLRWVEENLRCIRLPYSPAGDQAAVDAHTWRPVAQAIIISGPHSRWCYLLTEGRSSELPCNARVVAAARSVFDGLADYPVIDDGMLYAVEKEWQERAIPSLVRDYLRWGEQDECLSDLVEDMTEAETARFFREAETNAGGFEWSYECGYAHPLNSEGANEAMTAQAKLLLASLESRVCALGWRIVENDPDNPIYYGYCVPGGQPTAWYPSRYAALMEAADDRSFVDIQPTLPLDKPATAE